MGDSTGTLPTEPGRLPWAVEQYFALLNADDLRPFPDLWHEDAELVAFGRDGRRTRRGRPEVLRYYEHLFAPWSAHHDEIIGASVGTWTTVEILFTGRTHDDRPVAFDALDVFVLEDGRIRRLAIWHDVLTTRRLLG